MPEGPEVRLQADLLQRVVGSTIHGARVVSGRYLRKPITGLDELAGSRITAINNHGKLIYFALDGKRYIHSTLGMSGSWEAENLKHTRISLTLSKSTIHYHDPRNFGTLKIVSAAEHQEKLSLLGPDFSKPLDESVTTEIERRLSSYGSGCIAQSLLDQRIFCGIGNYLRADALYLAKINPHALKLSKRSLKNLVLRCIELSSLAYLERESYEFIIYKRRISKLGNPIVSELIGPRRIWWCPVEQVNLT